MPILGILASAITGNLVTNSYESIATVTVGGGGSSSISFSSIPSTFTHLQIRLLARTNDTDAGLDYAKLRFNSDSGANYALHQFFGPGATVTSFGNASQNEIWVQRMANDYLTAGMFAGSIVDILDYANTSKYKTTRGLGGVDGNGSGRIYFSSGLWQNTNAISSLVITPGSGTTFLQYSQFALYGIKGS